MHAIKAALKRVSGDAHSVCARTLLLHFRPTRYCVSLRSFDRVSCLTEYFQCFAALQSRVHEIWARFFSSTSLMDDP